MKTEPIVVTCNGLGMGEALEATEKLGIEAGLEKKPVIHLRLLAEELFGMLRGIAGEVEALFWIVTEGRSFEIHMNSEIKMTDEMRKQLYSASSSGKNSAAVSFTGKIRVMIAELLLSAKEVFPYAMINFASAYPMGGAAGEAAAVWRMSDYKDAVHKGVGTDKEASEAWDELEKSIIANIADEIKISIVGKKVEIVVFKSF